MTMTRMAVGMMLAAALSTGAGCKKKAADRASQGSGSGTGTGTGTGTGASTVPVDAADAPQPVDQEVLASNKLVDGLLAGRPYAKGPALSKAGDRLVWCLAGDNGMADFSEINCHLVPVGKGKPEVVPVMSYLDAVAIEEGSYSDNSADPGAKAKAAEATKRVTDAAAALATKAGSDLVAFAPTAKCDAGEGPDAQCTIGDATVALAQGVVTVTVGGKKLVDETFKPRGDGQTREAGLDCQLTASYVHAELDGAAKVLALSVTLANPSDTCAMVSQYEVRALALP